MKIRKKYYTHSFRPVLLKIKFSKGLNVSQQMCNGYLMVPHFHINTATMSICDKYRIGKHIRKILVYSLHSSRLVLV